MSAAGSLDLRLPIGGLFLILGVLLLGYGIFTNGDAHMYALSGGLNINLWWGIVMLATGVVFLVLARNDNTRAQARAAEAGTAAPPHKAGR